MVDEEKCVVTIDLDARGAVVGVELIVVNEFGIQELLKLAGIRAPKLMMDRASYLPAKHKAA